MTTRSGPPPMSQFLASIAATQAEMERQRAVYDHAQAEAQRKATQALQRVVRVDVLLVRPKACTDEGAAAAASLQRR